MSKTRNRSVTRFKQLLYRFDNCRNVDLEQMHQSSISNFLQFGTNIQYDNRSEELVFPADFLTDELFDGSQKNFVVNYGAIGSALAEKLIRLLGK